MYSLNIQRWRNKPACSRKCYLASDWSFRLLHGPYIRLLNTHLHYIRAVCTARIYGCVFDTRTYGPCIRPVQKKHFLQCFLTVRPVYTGGAYRAPVYIRPVYTARTKEAFLAMLFDSTALKYGWCVLSSRIYGPCKSLNDQSEAR